jgi:hypothetical protein
MATTLALPVKAATLHQPAVLSDALLLESLNAGTVLALVHCWQGLSLLQDLLSNAM